MTTEQAKQYLRDHPDDKVRQALEKLCLLDCLSSVKVTIEIDNEKRNETLESLLGAGLLAKAQAMRQDWND